MKNSTYCGFAGGFLCLAMLLAPASGYCNPDAGGNRSGVAVPSRVQVEKAPTLNKKGKSLAGFSSTVFGARKPAPRPDPHISKQIQKAKNLTPSEKKAILEKETKVTFYGKPEPIPDKAIAPRRATFTGSKETLSQMDEEDPTQMNVKYKVDDGTSARIAVNSQDQNSPIYTPLKKEEGLNSAGVYVDMDVDEDLKLQVGGEVRANETVNETSEDRSSAGAMVGLKWEF